jgi:hypothetical protein
MADGTLPEFDRAPRPARDAARPEAGSAAAVFSDEDAPGPEGRTEAGAEAGPLALLALARRTPPAAVLSDVVPAPATLAPEPGHGPAPRLVGVSPGALVETADGRVPVEELASGDRLITRDRGVQRLRWVGACGLGAGGLAFRPGLAPVRIARGALGGGLPERDLVLAPDHRLMLRHRRAQELFGRAEVMVAAGDLVGLAGVGRIVPARGADRQVHFLQLLCEGAALVRIEGLWCETFQPGSVRLAGLSLEDRATLVALQASDGGARGVLSGPGPQRPVLSRPQVRQLFRE